MGLAAPLVADLVVVGLQPQPERRFGAPYPFQRRGQSGYHWQRLRQQAIQLRHGAAQLGPKAGYGQTSRFHLVGYRRPRMGPAKLALLLDRLIGSALRHGVSLLAWVAEPAIHDTSRAVMKLSRSATVLLLNLVDVVGLRTAIAQQLFKPVDVEILDWGFSAKRIIGQQPAPGTASGYFLQGDPSEDTPITHAEQINACLGTQFGIRYRLKGYDDETSVPGAPIELTARLNVEWSHPPMHAPNGNILTIDRSWTIATPRARFSGWLFEGPYELVSGEWTIALRDGDRLLGQQTFQVSTGSDCARPVG